MSFRLKALERAKKYIGVKENPPGSNSGPIINGWQLRTNGVTGYPWCAAFIFCMFDDIGYTPKPKKPALVQSWVDWAYATGKAVRRPFKGDVVCYDWQATGPSWADHIGIVERVLAVRWFGDRFVGWIKTIEGNTSSTDQSNGGQVQRRYRWVNKKTVFIRIPGP